MVFLWTNSVLLIVGIFMILFGAVILLGAVGGSGGGAFRYRSGLHRSGQYVRRAEIEQKEREEKEDAD